MDKDMLENNMPETETTNNDAEKNDLYGDYPKEIVQILMKNSALKNQPENESLKADEEDLSSFSQTKVQTDAQSFIEGSELQKKKTEEIPFVEDSVPVKKDVKTKTDDFLFDDDEDMVQIVSHKDKKKEFKRAFASAERKVSSPKEEKKLETMKKVEPVKGEKSAEEVFKKRKPVFDMPVENTEFDELKNKFLKEKKAKKKEAIKTRNEVHNVNKDEIEKRKESYKKNADLNEFFELPKKGAAPSKRRAQIDRNIIIVCAIIVFVIIMLFVRSLSLSAKLEKAEEKVTQFEQLQKDNEELKLTIVTLEEYLTKNNIGLDGVPVEPEEQEEVPVAPEETTPSETGFDTYTVVAGDTLGGISEKVYGTFSDYKLILEANGLTETSNLQIGQELKIPKK